MIAIQITNTMRNDAFCLFIVMPSVQVLTVQNAFVRRESFWLLAYSCPGTFRRNRGIARNRVTANSGKPT